MAKRIRKSSVNKVQVVSEDKLEMIEPNTNVTEIPYQGFVSSQEFYTNMQMSCFELDSVINELANVHFNRNSFRQMSTEDAIEAYKALEKAKSERTRNFIELAKQASNNDFFNKMQELERLKLYGKNKIINGELVSQSNDTNSELVSENKDEKQVNEVDRNKEQHVLRLLQEAIVKKLERGDEE